MALQKWAMDNKLMRNGVGSRLLQSFKRIGLFNSDEAYFSLGLLPCRAMCCQVFYETRRLFELRIRCCALAVYTGRWPGEIGEDDYAARRAERFEYLVSGILVIRSP